MIYPKFVETIILVFEQSAPLGFPKKFGKFLKNLGNFPNNLGIPKKFGNFPKFGKVY